MFEDTSWVKAYANKKRDEAYKDEIKWRGEEKAKRYADNIYAKFTSFSINEWDMVDMQSEYLSTKMKKEYAKLTKAGKKTVSDAGKYTKKVISTVGNITSQDVSAGKQIVSKYLMDKYKNKVDDVFRFFED